ncbi:MAG: hypothetical protein WBC92_17840 [Terracidiphilus sp.]
MGLTGNEVSAADQQRRNEELSKSPIGGVLESATSGASAAVAFGASFAAGGPAGLAIAGSVVAGMRIVDWFRKLGTTKVEENLEALGQATEDAFDRVERVLGEQGKSIDEIKKRFESEELMQAMANASLQALRTTEGTRLKRLALILANGVKEGDLEPESLDDMMRAAVELTAYDIKILGSIYVMQIDMFSLSSLNWNYATRVNNIRSKWMRWWDSNSTSYQGTNGMAFNSSCIRLQATGLIASIGPQSVLRGPAINDYELLMEGKRFHERLQEISAAK